MFARNYRLPAQIKLSHPHTIHTPFFILKIATNKLLHNRYGFVAGKVIDKRAVVRNRLKRQFRAYIEQMHPVLQTHHDVLFILKKPATTVLMQHLHEKAKEVLEKQRLLKQ